MLKKKSQQGPHRFSRGLEGFKTLSQNSPESWGRVGQNEGAGMKSAVQTSALTQNSQQDGKECRLR